MSIPLDSSFNPQPEAQANTRNRREKFQRLRLRVKGKWLSASQISTVFRFKAGV